MTPTNQEHHAQDDPPPGPVVLQLVGADPEADALALANAMALRDDLEARSGRRVALIVLDPPPPPGPCEKVASHDRDRRPPPANTCP